MLKKKEQSQHLIDLGEKEFGTYKSLVLFYVSLARLQIVCLEKLLKEVLIINQILTSCQKSKFNKEILLFHRFDVQTSTAIASFAVTCGLRNFLY